MTEAAFLESGPADALLDERALSKLRWRCRRGLLENDLLIQRFFESHATRLTVGQARGLHALMDLADNDLLDLLLWRKDPEAEIIKTTHEISEVLGMLRGERTRVATGPRGEGPINKGKSSNETL